MLFLDLRSSSYGVDHSIIIVCPASVESLPFADEESNGDDFVNDMMLFPDPRSDLRSSSYGVDCSIIILRPATVESLPLVDEEINGGDFVNDIGCKSFESFAFKAVKFRKFRKQSLYLRRWRLHLSLHLQRRRLHLSLHLQRRRFHIHRCFVAAFLSSVFTKLDAS